MTKKTKSAGKAFEVEYKTTYIKEIEPLDIALCTAKDEKRWENEYIEAKEKFINEYEDEIKEVSTQRTIFGDKTTSTIKKIKNPKKGESEWNKRWKTKEVENGNWVLVNCSALTLSSAGQQNLIDKINELVEEVNSLKLNPPTK